MKAAFMGSDPIALPLLEHLLAARPAGIRLETLYTQPDRPSGRGLQLQPNAVKRWALQAGLEVRQPVKCSAAEADWLRAAGVDLVLVMAYGQILPGPLLEAAPLGFLNFHASLLPRLRGASPIQTAIAGGLGESGVCLMRIIPRLDAGPVAACQRVPIGPGDTAAHLQDNLARACVALADDCLPRLAAGGLRFTEQDGAAASYCRIIEKTDAHLDFNAPAAGLANRVRAFQPWPGTAFPLDGMDIRILRARAEAATPGAEPGTVALQPGAGLRIACADGDLVALELQRPGGRPMAADAFLRGFPIAPGTRIASRPMRPLEAAQPFPHRRRPVSLGGST